MIASLRRTPSVLLLALAFLGALSLPTGCANYSDPDGEWQSFTAEVVWIPAGGRHGSWGIRAQKFGKITPMETLPTAFREEGLMISGELLLRPDAGSIRAWGKAAELRNLKRAE